jgi:hypothetical protein
MAHMVHPGVSPEPRETRFRRGVQAIRERSGRVRERLRPQNLHAPSLDWLNFLIADVRGGLGPYVVVFLTTDQGWTPTMAGVVSTAGGWLGLATQTPIGAWLDRANRKRAGMLWALLALSGGAIVIAWFPSFWPVLLAYGAMQVVSGVFEPAVGPHGRPVHARGTDRAHGTQRRMGAGRKHRCSGFVRSRRQADI